MADSLDRQRHDLYLDWIRGLAALAVMVFHVRGEYFVKGIELDASSQTYANLFLFFMTGLAREAVVVFFVLSGFLVGGQAVIEARSASFSLQRYSIARIARLYTVLLPALALTAALDYAMGTWTAADGLGPFVINLLFLQSIFGPVYGSNAPLWSLAVEWWFYVIFGLAVYVFAHRGYGWRRVLAFSALALIVAMLAYFQKYILLMLPLWLVGVVARLAPGIGGRRWPMVPVVAFFFLSVAVSSDASSLMTDYLVAGATAALLWVLREFPVPRFRWMSVGRTLAAFSFSLYAFHYPLLLAFYSVQGWERETHAGILQWLQVGSIALGVCMVCFGLYWLFERQTPAVRRWLNARLNPDSRLNPTVAPAG